jgi:hypothetical protein
MRKLLITLCLLVSVPLISAGQTIGFGGGPGLSTGFPFYNLSDSYNRSGKFIIILKGLYRTGKPLSFSPSLTFFIPRVSKFTVPLEERKYTINGFMFDFNGHYAFISSEIFDLYGLTGFNIFLASKKEEIRFETDPVTHEKATYTSKINDNGLGINAGAGFSVRVSPKIELYAEAKYLMFSKYKLFISSYNQLMVNAGLLINYSIKKADTSTK